MSASCVCVRWILFFFLRWVLIANFQKDIEECYLGNVRFLLSNSTPQSIFSHAFTISQVLITCWPQQCRVSSEVHSALSRICVVQLHVLLCRKIAGSFFSLCRTSSVVLRFHIFIYKHRTLLSLRYCDGSLTVRLKRWSSLRYWWFWTFSRSWLCSPRPRIKECKLRHLIQVRVTLCQEQNCFLWHLVGLWRFLSSGTNFFRQGVRGWFK